MGATLTTYDSILKEFYLGAVQRQLNDATVLLANLERTSEHVEGRKIYIPLSYGGNSGVGSKAEAAALPTAGSQSYKETNAYVKYHYGRMEITGPVIRASAGPKGAFLKVVDAETKGIVRDVRKDINRQLFGDGTGQLTVIPDVTAGGANDIVVSASTYLTAGMELDIVDASATGTISSAYSVSSVSGTTVTLTPAGVEAVISGYGANSIVTRRGTFNTKEIEGLSILVDSAGTYHGLARGTYAWWAAGETAKGAALTLDMLQEGVDTVEIAGGTCDTLIMPYNLRRKLLSLLVAKKEFVNTLELKGGYKVLTFNDLPVMVDKDCPSGIVFFLDRSHIFISEMSNWDWADEGQGILRVVSGYDKYEAFLFWYSNLSCDNCSVQNKYTGVTV